MAKYIKLIDAFEDLPRYRQITITPVDYHPQHNSNILCNQFAETEEFHNWYAVMFKNELYFVSAEVSKFMFRVVATDNEDWYKDAIQCQENYAKLYENPDFRTQGVPLYKEFLSSLPQFLQEPYANCWLADTVTGWGRTGLAYLEKYTIKRLLGQTYFMPEYGSIGSDFADRSATKSLLPIVKAPNDILVDLHRKFDHPYTIKLP